jgi:hypothetical protein
MDGIYPTSTCFNNPNCSNKSNGGVWVSNAYIRNRGQPSFVTEQWDEGFQNKYTNNVPATQIYVRSASSTKDPSKQVFWINGWEQPRLILQAGRKYQFNVSTCGSPFIIDHPQAPISDYTLYTVIFKEPKKSRYYSNTNPAAFGELIVK